MPEQLSIFDDNPEYEAFVDKFKPKKTTDDCYTPPNIYEAVSYWVAREYNRDPSGFVRPFWPGGDYERCDYPPGCTVVDNPPFSILSQILKFYCARGIPFFLLAPTLTLFSGGGYLDVSYVLCGVQITYANGANVNTSFVTNLDTCRVRSAPGLYEAVRRTNEASIKEKAKSLPTYDYPDCILSAARSYKYSKYGIDYRLAKEDCTFIRRLDAMRNAGKDGGIFGGAFLLSERAAAEHADAERAATENAVAHRVAAERAAAERAAAERAAAHVWELSPREREIMRKLGAGAHYQETEAQTPAPDVFDLDYLLQKN